MKFAFYGRVSTEDQQDPVASRAWQVRRAVSLIEPHGGTIVKEFFDVAQSRSLPWSRRPEANALLQALRNPQRGFDAVVIGEPQRAFYGNQFGNVFPLFVHYGVGLWVPEVGGAVDPGSEAHELVMSLYGGMSKGERNRIKIRVKSTMAALAETEGRFLGGRPPYGYRLADAGPHPNASKAADGKRLHQLEPDPVTAPVVQRIFEEFVAGRGYYRIAEGLMQDGIPSPSAHDPARNRHRANTHGAWGRSAIRAILANPRYTGRQVWAKQRRVEQLISPDDVALGHETRMRWNPHDDWVRSREKAHPALVSDDLFLAAQDRLATGQHRGDVRKTRSPRPYALRGRVTCGVCGRKMSGTWNNGVPYYRCAFSAQYAIAKVIDHPRTVYLREAEVMPALDGWLARWFSGEDRAAEIVTLMAEAQVPTGPNANAEAAKAKIADCDRRLTQYRKALDAGGDAVTIGAWIAEVRRERSAAEALLNSSAPPDDLTEDDIRELVRSMQTVLRKLGTADPVKKAALFESLGISLTYHPERHSVTIEADLDICTQRRVGGGT